MLKKIYSFGGLNLRDSDINRSENQASDLQNVELTSTRELTQRSGFSEDTDLLGNPIVDTLEYRKTRELLLMSTAGLLARDGASLKTINFGGDVPADAWTEGIDYAEYANTVYFTDIAGNNDLFKYDGYMAFRAGIPQASGVLSGGGGAYFFRLAYYHIDLQGNITWGDYAQFENCAINQIFTMDTLKGTQFHNKFGTVSGLQTINSGNLTLNTTTHNYVVGDFIRAPKSVGGFGVLEIASVGATTITFASATEDFLFENSFPIESRTFVMVSKSLDRTFGYTVDGNFPLDQTATTDTVFAGAFLGTTPLNDVYDTGIVRGLPPRCKYITVYGGTTLVLGNNTNTKNFQTDLNNTSPQQESIIYWSSVYSEFGTSVENFLPFYTDIVGKSDEGEITGLFGAADSLVILKENQVYYMNGVLQALNYRPRSSLSERIGCISHRSIVEAEGGCLFMSPKGVYLAKYGQKPVEITDNIEPLFTDDQTGLDLSRARGEIDFLREKIYWFIPATEKEDDLLIMLDYYYKEWFKHTGIHADSGLTLINDVDMFHTDGITLYLRDNSLNDGTINNIEVPIDAFYATHWHHLDMPSVRKKFTNFVLASLSPIVWDCQIKTQEDWNEIDRTDVTLSMDGVKKIDDKRVNITQCKSCRFILRNNLRKQSLFISGYEFIVEGTQETPKGES
jgi:hypothetical protein